MAAIFIRRYCILVFSVFRHARQHIPLLRHVRPLLRQDLSSIGEVLTSISKSQVPGLQIVFKKGGAALLVENVFVLEGVQGRKISAVASWSV